MDTQLHLGKYRVQTKKGTLDIYRQLKGVVFNEFHNLFTICVFLGNKNGGPITENVKREQIFWSDTFNAYEYASFYSLVISKCEKEDYSIIKDGQKTLNLLQCYADRGMEVLLKSDFLKRHVKKNNDEFILEFSSSDFLPKQFMYYIHSEYKSIKK